MALSQMCKHEEHSLCPPHGRVIRTNGKSIGCSCSCHQPYKAAKEEAARRRREEKAEREQEQS